ncbi:MAG: C4-dicarboxylate ABC transporter substrate-binding protein, partial [Pseudomonadales bacterium]|nr:C4-dicarboxylate ABC transporter substrate-binding protein [Pseudomonadales bacterium]
MDAFFYTVGHPNGSIKEATSGRIRVRIIEMKGAALKDFFDRHPYYTASTIHRHHYPNAVNTGDIRT